MAETISKKDAVRRAMAALGDEARPADMRDWIKQNFNIDMTADHVSTARGEVRRERAGKPKKAARKPAAKAPAARASPAPQPQAGARPASGGKRESAIPLDDILTVRQLVDRHGAGP